MSKTSDLEKRVKDLEAKCNYCCVAEKFEVFLKSLKKEVKYISGHYEVLSERKETGK